MSEEAKANQDIIDDFFMMMNMGMETKTNIFL